MMRSIAGAALILAALPGLLGCQSDEDKVVRPEGLEWLPQPSEFGAEIVECEDSMFGEIGERALFDGYILQGSEPQVILVECWSSPAMGDEQADADRLSAALAEAANGNLALGPACSPPLGDPRNANDVGIVMSVCQGVIVLEDSSPATIVYFTAGAALAPWDWMDMVNEGVDWSTYDWATYPKDWVLVVATDPTGRAAVEPLPFAPGTWESEDGTASVTLHEDGTGQVVGIPVVPEDAYGGCDEAAPGAGPVTWEWLATDRFLMTTLEDGATIEFSAGGAWLNDWRELMTFVCDYDHTATILTATD